MGNEREASDAGFQLFILAETMGMASVEQSIARTAAREVPFAVEVAEQTGHSAPATVDELLEMMNQRLGVTARLADGDDLRYLNAIDAGGLHMLEEGGRSTILLRPDSANRWTAFHEWMHRILQRPRGGPMPGEDNFIEGFLQRHQQLLRIKRPAVRP
jgi:hypothetical protein